MSLSKSQNNLLLGDMETCLGENIYMFIDGTLRTVI